MASDNSMIAHLVANLPLLPIAPHMAWVMACAIAVAAQRRRGLEQIGGGALPEAVRHRTPHADAAFATLTLRNAVSGLHAAVLDFLDRAEAEAEQLDAAALAVMQGRARVVEADGVTSVYRLNGAAGPIATTAAELRE